MARLLYPGILTVVKINGRRLNKAYFKLRKFQAEIPQWKDCLQEISPVLIDRQKHTAWNNYFQSEYLIWVNQGIVIPLPESLWNFDQRCNVINVVIYSVRESEGIYPVICKDQLQNRNLTEANTDFYSLKKMHKLPIATIYRDRKYPSHQKDPGTT